MGWRWRRGAAGQVRFQPSAQISSEPDLVRANPNQVAVLAAYSLLSYLSLSAHNAWMRENTVSQTHPDLYARLSIVAASVKTIAHPKMIHVDAAACILERIRITVIVVK